MPDRRPLATALVLALAASAAAPAAAKGTRAGDVIVNVAKATYTAPGGGTAEVSTPEVKVTVDELIDVKVEAKPAGAVSVTPGGADKVIRFEVANLGNGVESFILTPFANEGSDDFDPTGLQMFVDSNGNGLPDPDELLPAGAPVAFGLDEIKAVLLVGDIPATATDGQRGALRLLAAAQTGTGAPGAAFAGQGDGGVTAVLGASGGDDEATNAFLVSASSVTLEKTARVVDPARGDRPLPGASIVYTLTARVTGSSPVADLVVTDPIPVGSDYVPGTLTLGGAALTDADDTDAGRGDATGVRVALGTVPANESRVVTFTVKIKE